MFIILLLKALSVRVEDACAYVLRKGHVREVSHRDAQDRTQTSR